MPDTVTNLARHLGARPVVQAWGAGFYAGYKAAQERVDSACKVDICGLTDEYLASYLKLLPTVYLPSKLR